MADENVELQNDLQSIKDICIRLKDVSIPPDIYWHRSVLDVIEKIVHALEEKIAAVPKSQSLDTAQPAIQILRARLQNVEPLLQKLIGKTPDYSTFQAEIKALKQELAIIDHAITEFITDMSDKHHGEIAFLAKIEERKKYLIHKGFNVYRYPDLANILAMNWELIQELYKMAGQASKRTHYGYDYTGHYMSYIWDGFSNYSNLLDNITLSQTSSHGSGQDLSLDEAYRDYTEGIRNSPHQVHNDQLMAMQRKSAQDIKTILMFLANAIFAESSGEYIDRYVMPRLHDLRSHITGMSDLRELHSFVMFRTLNLSAAEKDNWIKFLYEIIAWVLPYQHYYSSLHEQFAFVSRNIDRYEHDLEKYLKENVIYFSFSGFRQYCSDRGLFETVFESLITLKVEDIRDNLSIGDATYETIFTAIVRDTNLPFCVDSHKRAFAITRELKYPELQKYLAKEIEKRAKDGHRLSSDDLEILFKSLIKIKEKVGKIYASKDILRNLVAKVMFDVECSIERMSPDEIYIVLDELIALELLMAKENSNSQYFNLRRYVKVLDVSSVRIMIALAMKFHTIPEFHSNSLFFARLVDPLLQQENPLTVIDDIGKIFLNMDPTLRRTKIVWLTRLFDSEGDNQQTQLEIVHALVSEHTLNAILKKSLYAYNIDTREQLIEFINLLPILELDLAQSLRNIVASTLVLQRNRQDIEAFPDIERVINGLLAGPLPDSETKYLLLELRKLLPSGNIGGINLQNPLIADIRQDALDIANLSNAILEESVHQKIHNWPSKEDVNLIAGLKEFWETGDITRFKEICDSIDVFLRIRETQASRTDEVFTRLSDFRKDMLARQSDISSTDIYIKTSRLLDNLKKLWNIDIGPLKEASLGQTLSSPEGKEFHQLVNEFTRNVDAQDLRSAAKILGRLRTTVTRLSVVQPALTQFLNDVEEVLNNNEHIIYSTVTGNFFVNREGSVIQLKSRSMTKDAFNDALLFIEQMLQSVIANGMDGLLNEDGTATHTLKPRARYFSEALRLLKRYRISKGPSTYITEKLHLSQEMNETDIIEAMHLIQRGIDAFSEVIITDLRKRLGEKLPQAPNTPAAIESLVANFYKTGAIYNLGEMSGYILSVLTGGEGIIVCSGEAWGKVKIVLSAKDAADFTQGDIFVSRNPTPEVQEWMMIASAIITEEGGSTSHAAMIAREHKIPCIVGRPRVTSEFKDGEYVHVDANTGKIERISEHEALKHLAQNPAAENEELKELSFFELFSSDDLSAYLALKESTYAIMLDEASDSTIVGGKAVNLCRLRKMQQDFSVPNGFVVTTVAYVKTLLHNYAYLVQSLKNINAMSEESIREIFMRLEVPHDVMKAIEECYSKIGGRLFEKTQISVRSSATTEDTADSTFAGMHDTFLFRRGTDQIISNLKRCWASLYTKRALLHRRKFGIDEKEAKMAVVVQKMVYADYSGVIYTEITEDSFYYIPDGLVTKKMELNKSKDMMKIEAVPGAGEELVSGRKTPTLYTYDKTKDSWWHLSGKSSPELEAVIKTLAHAAIHIEHNSNAPQDIEFCIKGDKIFILQTRDIAVAKHQ